MTNDRDIIEDAERAAESLRYLGKSTLAPGDNNDFQGDVDLLMDVVNLVKRAREFQAGVGMAFTQKFSPVDDVRHPECGAVMAKAQSGPQSLYELLLLAGRHDCLPKAERPTEVDEAKKQLRDAYKQAVGLNIFDTDTAKVMDAALGLVHAVVKAERDRVAAEYENSGIHDHADWDALDRLVDMTEPGKLRV